MNVARTLLAVVTAPLRFLTEVGKELKEVTWPTRRATIQSTLIVIALSLIVGVYIAALDFAATKGLDVLIAR